MVTPKFTPSSPTDPSLVPQEQLAHWAIEVARNLGTGGGSVTQPLILTADPGQTVPIFVVKNENTDSFFAVYQQDLYSGSSPVNLDSLFGGVFVANTPPAAAIQQGTLYAQARRISDGGTGYVQLQGGGTGTDDIYAQMVFGGADLLLPHASDDGTQFPFYAYSEGTGGATGYTFVKIAAQPGQGSYGLLGLYQDTNCTSNIFHAYLTSPTTGLTVTNAFYIRQNGRMYDYAPDAAIHPAEMPVAGGLTRRWTDSTKRVTLAVKAADASMRSVDIPTAVSTNGDPGALLLATTAQLTRNIQLLVSDPTAALATGDGQAYFFIPANMNGYTLTAVQANVITVSTSGLPTVQIANVTQGWDTLTTKLTIDANEHDSSTAATPAVIDTASSHNVATTGDEFRIDVDVAGTGTKGLMVNLVFTPA